VVVSLGLWDIGSGVQRGVGVWGLRGTGFGEAADRGVGQLLYLLSLTEYHEDDKL